MKCLLKIIAILSLLVLVVVTMIGVYFAAVIYSFPAGNGSVVLEPNGRLGNQMFQYAAAYSLAKQTNSKLYLIVNRDHKGRAIDFPIEYFDLAKESVIWKNQVNWVAIQGIKFDWLLNKITNQSVRESLRSYSNQLNEELKPLLRSYLHITQVTEGNFFNYSNKINQQVLFVDDNFESEIFFANLQDDIFNIFTPKNIDKKLSDLIARVSKDDAVCVHVRRGDMAKAVEFFMPIDYQKQAIELAKKMIKEPKFFIFSDDIDLVKQELGIQNFTFVEGNTMEDFVVMNKCTNIIIANSTYSWWAAYLNKSKNHLVIAPSPRVNEAFFRGVLDLNRRSVKRDLYKNHAYPKGWMTLKYTQNIP